MKYVILVRSNPRILEVWEQMSEQQRIAFGRAHQDLDAEMVRAGVHVASAGLAGPSCARGVSVRDGEVIVSDGPFAEVKEHLAGFYLIDCPSMQEALAWAARVPDAAHVEVEVRPVLDDLSGAEF